MMTSRRRSHTPGVSLAIAVLGIAIAITGSRAILAARAQAPDVNGIAPEGLAQIEALLREKETRTPAERKIDSQLLYARRRSGPGGSAPDSAGGKDKCTASKAPD